MKKASAVLCAVFLAAGLSFAAPKNLDTKKSDAKDRKERMAEIMKDKENYLKKLGALTNKYNKASGKNKESVIKEIKTFIASETDRELVQKKEMLAAQKERIAKYEAQIAEIENDKEDYINKKVAEALTPEGQEKIKEARERLNKKGNDKTEKNLKSNL